MSPHPRVADHEVLDGGALGMAEVQRAGDVRRRLDDDEGRLRRIRARTGAVGREDVGREPALVDRALDLARLVGPGKRRGLRRLGHCSVSVVVRGHRSWLYVPPCPGAPSPGSRTTRSSSGRNGSWYHLLVRRPGRTGHRGPRLRPSPPFGVRTPSRRAIGRQPSRLASDLRAGGSCGPSTVARSLGRPARRYSSRSSPRGAEHSTGFPAPCRWCPKLIGGLLPRTVPRTARWEFPGLPDTNTVRAASEVDIATAEASR